MSRQAVKDKKKFLLDGIGVPEKSEFLVDDFQREAIDAIANGEDTLVVAPTGSGKTFIATQAISVALGLNSKAVYTTPLKALSNSKFTELKKLFEPQYRVGLLTGDRKIETNADVVVATTEIYRNELYSEPGRYGVVVLDEVHFIADLQRGPVWEESIILTPKDATLLMLSASISNPHEIADWLHDVRGKPCRVVIKKERPVELRFGFIDPDRGVMPLYEKSGRILAEVAEYYQGARLDHSGMRLFSPKPRNKKSDRENEDRYRKPSRNSRRRRR
jgi:superfamily II RNA helicase